MNENLEEKQNVEIDEEKVVKDALDVYVKEEKERIKKSKEDKFERLKKKAKKEEEIKLKRIEEEAEVRIRRMKKDVKTETEMKILKFKENWLEKRLYLVTSQNNILSAEAKILRGAIMDYFASEE